MSMDSKNRRKNWGRSLFLDHVQARGEGNSDIFTPSLLGVKKNS